MSTLKRIKIIFKKLGFILTLSPSILLILGCVFIFLADNFLSFGFSLILPILLVLNLIIGVYWLIRKNKFFLVSLCCIILYFIYFDSFFQFNQLVGAELNKTSSKLDTLSILSFNTNGFNHKNNKGKVKIDEDILYFIKNKKPDVFCVQEFSAIKYRLFLNDYPYWFKTNRITESKSVMAIFSKHPIIDKGYIDFPNTSNGAMYVDLAFNKKALRIYNLHFESFKVRRSFYNFNEVTDYESLRYRVNKTEKMRKEQVVIIKKHIDTFKGKVIICGDFNSTQFSSTYNILKDSKKDTFIEEGFGLGTTYRVFNYPFRLDYILVDDSFEVLSHQNFDLKISDHEPILTRLLVN